MRILFQTETESNDTESNDAPLFVELIKHEDEEFAFLSIGTLDNFASESEISASLDIDTARQLARAILMAVGE